MIYIVDWDIISMIIECKDRENLVLTKQYPKEIAHFPFEKFNPVQSRVFEHYNKDCNLVVAASTSAGKTVCSEMVAAHAVRVLGKKVIYLAPLKSLAKEKIDDWSDKEHHFGDLNLSICTGDYRLTPERKKELERANIIVMTSEMLGARTRNYQAEHNEFLKDVGVIVVDECHLLTVPNRGDKLEVGLMKFTQIAPESKLVLLSATMPNVKQIAEWASSLNKKDTCLITSTYRPCALDIHYETYFERSNYEDTEMAKCLEAVRLVKKYKDDKFLVFVHSIRTGQMMKTLFKRVGLDCEFHSANLEKEERHSLENRFKTDSKFRVLVATSTLAWGVNCPARRVIITGVHRGLDIVENYDVWQMVGRSGRPAYDPKGDAYILLPDHEKELFIKYINTPRNIESQLLSKDSEFQCHKVLAFHLVSEIHHRTVKNKQDIKEWYNRSLAHFQAEKLDDDVIESTLELLLKRGCIKEEDGEYSVTMIGAIASMFYYPPLDVADLARNFKWIFENNLQEKDIIVSLKLAEIDSNKGKVVNKLEREEIADYVSKTQIMFSSKTPPESVLKAGYVYYCLMNGRNMEGLYGYAKQLQMDFPRCVAVLKAIDGMKAKWKQDVFWRKLQARMIYGVRGDLVDLVQIPNIGKVRAEKLWAGGIRDLETIVNQPEKVYRVLNMKQEAIDKICEAAKTLLLVQAQDIQS